MFRPRHWVLFDLFVALLIDTYMHMRDVRSKTAFLSPGQRVWVSNMRMLLTIRLPPPRKPWPTRSRVFNAVRGVVFRFVQRSAFENIILCVIVINIAFMCLTHYGASASWLIAQESAAAVFTAIFGLEAVLKLIALGFKVYFDSWSNVFDFTLAAGSIVAEGVSQPSIGREFPLHSIHIKCHP